MTDPYATLRFPWYAMMIINVDTVNCLELLEAFGFINGNLKDGDDQCYQIFLCHIRLDAMQIQPLRKPAV